jgi:ABC-type transport system involved in cytochrome bd biosynthesis fused ATPase/permease subunit
VNVFPKEGKVPGRRWVLLVLAAIVGFVGSGVLKSPAAILTVLAALFVTVFVIALAFSMLTEPSPLEPESDEAVARQVFTEAPQVQQEALYGSP